MHAESLSRQGISRAYEYLVEKTDEMREFLQALMGLAHGPQLSGFAVYLDEAAAELDDR